MKFWKESLLTAFGFIAIASTVLYQSCTPDQCASVNCYYGAVCNAGVCNCGPAYEGSDCSKLAITKFIGTYTGTSSCDGNPVMEDTADVYMVGPKDLNDVKVVLHSNNIVLSGTIIAGSLDITVPDSGYGDYSRHLQVSLTNTTKLTIYNEQHFLGPKLEQEKSICTFVGNKPMK